MKKLVSVPALLLVIGLLGLPAFAQETTAPKKDEKPKAAFGLSQAVLGQWNDIGRKLIAMAEDFPEDKYEFKPTPAQRSFAEQLLHAAGANYFFTSLASGQKPPAQEDPSRATYKTKADVVAFVKKSFADGAALIKAKGDAGMTAMMVDPFENREVRTFEWAYGFMEHSGEHYGQLVVYYRLAGLVPPESRPKK